MNETLEILEKAAEGLLPDNISDSSEINIDLFCELRLCGYISATDITNEKGLEITSPKITDLGRIYLNSLKNDYY